MSFDRPDWAALTHDDVYPLADAPEDEPFEEFTYATEAEAWAGLRMMAFVTANTDLMAYANLPFRRDDGMWVLQIGVPSW